MDERSPLNQRALVRVSYVDRNSTELLAMAFERLSPQNEPLEPGQTGVQEADQCAPYQQFQESR